MAAPSGLSGAPQPRRVWHMHAQQQDTPSLASTGCPHAHTCTHTRTRLPARRGRRTNEWHTQRMQRTTHEYRIVDTRAGQAPQRLPRAQAQTTAQQQHASSMRARTHSLPLAVLLRSAPGDAAPTPTNNARGRGRANCCCAHAARPPASQRLVLAAAPPLLLLLLRLPACAPPHWCCWPSVRHATITRARTHNESRHSTADKRPACMHASPQVRSVQLYTHTQPRARSCTAPSGPQSHAHCPVHAHTAAAFTAHTSARACIHASRKRPARTLSPPPPQPRPPHQRLGVCKQLDVYGWRWCAAPQKGGWGAATGGAGRPRTSSTDGQFDRHTHAKGKGRGQSDTAPLALVHRPLKGAVVSASPRPAQTAPAQTSAPGRSRHTQSHKLGEGRGRPAATLARTQTHNMRVCNM